MIKKIDFVTEKFKAANEKLSVIKKTKYVNEAIEKDSVENERLLQEECEGHEKINNLMSCARNLHFEIKV